MLTVNTALRRFLKAIKKSLSALYRCIGNVLESKRPKFCSPEKNFSEAKLRYFRTRKGRRTPARTNSSHRTLHWVQKKEPFGSLQVHRQRPIFPDRLQSSIFGDEKLNFCVRYGNRWILLSMVTNTGIINRFLYELSN